MIEKLTLTIGEFMGFYYDFVLREWNHMTPMKYGGILISIGVFGWLLMKSGAKR